MHKTARDITMEERNKIQTANKRVTNKSLPDQFQIDFFTRFIE